MSLTPEAFTPEIRIRIPDKIDQAGQKARNDFCRDELQKRFPPHEDFSEGVVDCQWHPEGERFKFLTPASVFRVIMLRDNALLVSFQIEILSFPW